MLTHLSIRNYAIIASAELSFGPQLNIITGETGAGKSIIMGALGLILGKRADSSVLLNEEEKCVVEAQIDISNYNLEAFFEENDLDFSQQSVIRREINPKGKSRAFINDVPATLEVLRSLTIQLMDIHAQHENRDLEDDGFFIRIADKLAGNQVLMEEYTSTLQTYKSIKKELNAFKEQAAAFAKEYDYLKFLYDELDVLTLSVEQWNSALEEIAVLEHAESIRHHLEASAELLQNGQFNAWDLIAETQKHLSSVSTYHSDLEEIHQEVAEIQDRLHEINRRIQSRHSATESDDNRLQELLEQQSAINRLMQKHQTNEIADLIALHQKLGEQLGKFSFSEEKIAELELACDELLEKVKDQAFVISQRRKDASKGFYAAVSGLLNEMGMPFAKVELDFQSKEMPGTTGIDDVTLLFAPNKGSKLSSLQQVGSGGEKSRLMLAIKSLIAKEMALPTLIFDEIDTGISGEVAFKVGQLLKDIGKSHQVITITHLPQIAAAGSTHFDVYKDHSLSVSITKIRAINSEEIVESLAKMLSGEKISEAAKNNAKSLINSYI